MGAAGTAVALDASWYVFAGFSLQVFPKMNLVAIEAGGTLTTYENNRVQERTEFSGPAANELTRVDIPLVYPDNNLFLQQLQQAAGCPILQNNTNNPDVL